eukprot:Skav235557  [mRNA]  locus=scaffold3067:322435:336497:- [translate_table: standard]
MAVYFDPAPSSLEPAWIRDETNYSSEGEGDVMTELGEVGDWSWPKVYWVKGWDTKTRGSYGEYLSSWNEAVQMDAYQAANSLRSFNQFWQTSTAMFHSLPVEPKEILVVKSSSSGSYASLCSDSRTADVVAFDAEWVPDFGYGSDNPISVLQLAFPASKRVYVVQLGPLGKKLPQEVKLMLVNPDVLKVGFAVNYKDAQKLVRTGIAVTQGSVVDVRERCASTMGLGWGAEQSLSLRRAAGALLNCELLKDKKCACSDWSSEQLTPEQVHYAALDAWVALRLYYLLH